MIHDVYAHAINIFDRNSVEKTCDNLTDMHAGFIVDYNDYQFKIMNRVIDDGFRIEGSDGLFMVVLNENQACQVLDQIKERYSSNYKSFVPDEYTVKVDEQYIVKIDDKYFNKKKLTKHITKAHKFNKYHKAKKIAKSHNGIIYEIKSEYNLKQI